MDPSKFETPEGKIKKQWFVKNYTKYDPKIKKNESDRLADIWINMIQIGCRYPMPIEKQIQDFLKFAEKNAK